MWIVVAAATLSAAQLLAPDAQAQQIGEALAARLTPEQQRAYVLYLRARTHFEREEAAYWAAVEEKRELRRGKRRAGAAFTADDFVVVQPPQYGGPPFPKDVGQILAEMRKPEPQSEEAATVTDFLAHARKEYGFVPAPTTEAIFKRRYADEALQLGLSKDQVVRVYALETGGRGTYDMQAGIDPETKKGRPISSALGYAQLLAANSVNELVKHGDGFITRLGALAAAPGTSASRVQHLRTKAVAVRRMLRAARAVPNTWNAHVDLARAPKGQGIHALNLDADIGPWLQTIKLKGVREYAEKAGRPRLTGAEIELMNLAGPQTGLDMMDTVGRDMPTSNFFAQKAYERNPIVKDRTGAQLLKALDERMNVNLLKAGSVEFAKVFDSALAAGSARSARR